MRRLEELSWKRIPLATPLLATLVLATAVLANLGGAAYAGDPGDDERRVVGKVLRLEDCPEVKVLGSGHARVLSLSPHGFLGVETSALTPELRRHFGAPEDAGVMLSRVLEDSAAQAAGLAVGDIVTRVDGEEITSTSGLGRMIRHKEGGTVVDIEYWRDGAVFEIQATLAERKRCSFDIGDTLRTLDIEDLPELGTLGLEIGGEAMETALEALRETLDSQDWEKHFEGLKVLDLDDIEERLETVQEKLEQIERRLEREYGGDLERAERGLERAERDRARAERDRERSERERDRSERDREEADQGNGDVY